MTNGNGSPLRPEEMDDLIEEDGGGSGDRGIVIDEEGDSLDDDDVMEVIYDEDLLEDDFEGEGRDRGNLGDIEDEGEEDEGEPGLDGFEGVKPNHILTAHMGSAVFCVAFDPKNQKIVTGGEDDCANYWEFEENPRIPCTSPQVPIFKCKGHNDSVISASFSHDSVYLATCDLSGVVKIWKTNSDPKLITEVITFETADISWSFWHPKSYVLFAGTEDGLVYMWKIPSGECKTYSGSASKCECGTLLPDGKRIVAGYSDGTVKMFDLKSGEVIYHFSKATDKENPVSILCIDHDKHRSLVATGCSDGSVKLYNTENGKFLSEWSCIPPSIPAENEGENEEDTTVECVTFQPHSPGTQGTAFDYLAAGTVKGHILILDITQMSERVRMKLDAGLSKIIWNPQLPIIYVGCLDGVIRVIDARTCKEEKVLGRHRGEVLDLDITKSGTKLVSASMDGSAFIFTLN